MPTLHRAVKYDIIANVGNGMDNIVAVTFAIAGALALPLRSDAVSRKISTPPLGAM